MPMTAVRRSSGLGPDVDPGDLGWEAMGMGVHPGAGLDLLGNYPIAQRNQIMHSTDWMAYGPPTGPTGPVMMANPGAYSGSGALSDAQEKRMLAAMNQWEKAAWTGQGDPGNYVRVGNQLMTRQAAGLPQIGGEAPAPVSREVSLDEFYAGLPGGNPYGPNPSAAPTATQAPVYAPEASTAAGAGPAPTSPPPSSTRTRRAGVNPNAAAAGAPNVSAGAANLTQGTQTPQGSTMPQDLISSQWPDTGPATPSGLGDIIGTTGRGYDSAYGGIPYIPDPISSQFGSLEGNLQNLGSLFNLSGNLNTFGANQAQRQYQLNLPQYDQMMQQASSNIVSNLAGEVPPDVINLLQQQGAERGVGMGAVGSPNAGAQYLKALGLTSIGQQDKGQTQLTQAIQRTPTSPLFNVASQMISPQEMQAARYMANIYGAAPNPRAAAEEAMRNAEEAMRAGASMAGGGGTTIGGSLAGGGPPSTTYTQPGANLPTYVYGGGGNQNMGPGSVWSWLASQGQGGIGTSAGGGGGSTSFQFGWPGFGEPYGTNADLTGADDWIFGPTGTQDEWSQFYDDQTGGWFDDTGSGDWMSEYYDDETGGWY